MPSPSMGFFCQSKLSNSQSEIQRGLQPCNPPQDSLPSVSKAGIVNSTQRRPPQPYRKIPTCSSTVKSVTSIAENVASCGIIESESESSDIHPKEAFQLQVNSDRVNEANNDLQMHDADLESPDDVKTCENVGKFSTKNMGLQIYDIKFPPLSDPCEQAGKDDTHRDVNVCTGSRDSSGVGIDLQHCASPFQLVEVECPSGANKTSAKQQEEGSVCENHSIKPDSEVQGQRHNGTMMEDLRYSESCDEDYLSLTADYVPKVQDCVDVSRSPAHSTEMERKKDETSGIDYWKGGLHVGEMQRLSPDSSVLVRSCKSLTNTSAENSNRMNFNSQCAKPAGQTEILNCFVTLEQVPQNICESASKGGVEHGRWPEACPEINNKFTEHTTSMNNDLCRSGSEMHATHLSGMDEFELCPQQAELKKHGTSRVDPIFEIQSQRLNETLIEDCQSSKNGDKDYNSNATDDALEVQECGAVSHSPAHSTEMEHTKHETSATDCLKRDLHKGEVKILSEESSLLVGNCKSLSETSAADSERMIFNSPSTKLVDQMEILDSCATSEQGCQDICEPASKGGFEHGKYSEVTFFVESCKSLTNTPAETGQMECFNAGNAFRASVDNELLATSFRHNTENNPLVSEVEYQIDMIGEIISDNIISEKECQNSVGSKIENPNADSQINDRQAEFATGINYMGLHGVVDKESGLEASNSPKKPPEDVKDSMPSLTSDKSGGSKKQGAPTIKVPPNAVPFSDEWLAALEAAGEEVLARKGGAVQNSSPDKSLPEPSPWSPVKQKNREIGPFDCTKLKIQQPNPLSPFFHCLRLQDY